MEIMASEGTTILWNEDSGRTPAEARSLGPSWRRKATGMRDLITTAGGRVNGEEIEC